MIMHATRRGSKVIGGIMKEATKALCPLSADDAVAQARLLRALADPTRLRILSLLKKHGGQVCVVEIAENFTLEQPSISHHLRNLLSAGLIDCHRQGHWTYYYVRLETLKRAQN